MLQTIRTFIGRKQELEQWQSLLSQPAAEGQAVVVVGKYGMGKTWFLDQMIRQAQEDHALRCYAVRYVMAPGESPGMILRMILDDIFQAARYEAGSLDASGKRFGQWVRMYRELGLFTQHTDPGFRFLEQLRFDGHKNIFEQFTNRLKLFSDLLPEQGRLLLAIDPEHDTLAARVELWAQVVKKLPPKVFFLFAQRFQDALAMNDEFRSQRNVHFIPPLDSHPGGLADLRDDETEQLIDAYLPFLADKNIDRQAVSGRFRLYRNHPYAVHATLNLLLLPGVSVPDQLPAEQTPAAVCPIQWRGVTEHPLHEDAVRLLKTYAVLEVPSLDEMTCWVADIAPERLAEILADPFLSSLIRSDADGRLLYHHYLSTYIRSLLYTKDGKPTPEAEQLHQRAMTGYRDLTNRTIKPDPLALVRLAEHSLVVGGPSLFAATLCDCSESFLSLGFYQTYAALLDRALAIVPSISAEAADLYLLLGQLRLHQEAHQAAIKLFEISMQMALRIAEPERIASALAWLGRAALKSGHLTEAHTWLQDATSYYEDSKDKQGLAEVLLLSAKVLWLQGHTKDAEKKLDTALQVTGEIRHYRQQAKMMASIYAVWGRMYDQMGNVERSAEQYHKALDLTKDIYDQEAEAELRTSLGSILERIGNLKSAEEHVSKAMSIHHDLKLLEQWAEDNVRLARIAEMQGKPQAKESYLEQARKIYQQLGNKQKLAELEHR